MNNTIGIIGGADGPTAIFVTTKMSPLFYVGAALLVIAIAALIVYLLKGRRK